MMKKILVCFMALFAAVFSLALVAFLLIPVFLGTGISQSRAQSESVNLVAADRFHMQMTNKLSSALEGVLDIKKVYWLRDDDLVAPKPNPEGYGTAGTPEEIRKLLQDAQPLLEGQRTALTPETPLAPKNQVTYYLDETIFVATWKQTFEEAIYTISEIKIAHPSQFRRFLSGGSYGSGIQLTTTEMADSVNAVVASTGDFYAFRKYGIIVYDGTVQRVSADAVDTCYIDDQGDMLFSYRGELNNMEDAQKFVDENNIRFSLAFGPALIDQGRKTEFPGYILGEVYQRYARAGLCQMDSLHYLLVVVSAENDYLQHATMKEFQDVIASFGPKMAYSLDGGQSAVIAMQGQTINNVNFGYQRKISDIIYFATALPERE